MRTLWNHLIERAALQADQVAIVNAFDSSEMTFSQLWNEVDSLSREFRRMRMSSVVLALPNSTPTLTAYLACLVSGVDCCIVGDVFAEQELARVLSAIKPDFLLVNERVENPVGGSTTHGVITLSIDTVRDSAFAGPSEAVEPKFSNAYGRQLVATSGSTGEPKLLALSGEHLWASAETFGSVYKLGPRNIFWNYLPMSYLGGTFNLLLIPLASCSKVVVDNSFNASTLLKFLGTVERFEINTIWFVPTILRGLRRLLESSSEQSVFPGQILAFIGTAPSTFAERRWLEELIGCHVYENYGLTETTFLLFEPLRGPGHDAPTAMQAFPKVTFSNLQHGKTLRVKTPFLFEGYFSAHSGYVPVEREDWFDTGDLIHAEAGQGFVVSGREKDVIKKGGVLINLMAIESFARELVTWGDVAVLPVEDEFYGENYNVVFETRGVSTDRADIVAHLSRFLTKQRMPRDVVELQSIPKTRTGKVDRKSSMRALANAKVSRGLK